MTWGQIRLLLTATAPGIHPDLLDEWIGTRYGLILDHYPWKGLEVETMLQTVAAYTTGTVSVAVGAGVVVGVGTVFTEAMEGYRLLIAGDTRLYTVAFTDATHMALDRGYEGIAGASAAGAGFTLFQPIYSLPADLKLILSIDSPVTGLPLDKWTKKFLDESVGPRIGLGDPTAWAINADTPESDPPVLHTVELYPAPKVARGYPLRYQKAAVGFTGENTGSVPLPWVAPKAILDGARAEIWTHAKDLAAADRYEAKFAVDLAEMVRIDGQRRGMPEIRMPAAYTNHRIRRILR